MAVPFVSTRKQRFLLCLHVCVLFAFAKANSQTITSQGSSTVLLHSGITHVDITLEDHVELHIITHKDKTYNLSENQYGEYQQAIMLRTAQRNDTLFVGDPQNPSFKYPNDKLSAHKVIDGRATLYIPEGKTLFITAASADITITGNYRSITVNLKNGKCDLKNVQANFNIVTVYAPVHIVASNAHIEASSLNGSVTNNNKLKTSNFKGKIESINGSISIE